VLCNKWSLFSHKWKEERNIHLLSACLTEMKSTDRFQGEFHAMQSVEFIFTQRSEKRNICLLSAGLTELKSTDRFQSEFHCPMQSVEFNFTLSATGFQLKTGDLETVKSIPLGSFRINKCKLLEIF